MAEFESYAHGCPCWIDLSTSDPEAAKQFYGGLFDWEAEDVPTDQGPPYTMFRRNGKTVAGGMIQPPPEKDMGVPPHWNTYIAVDDLDSAAVRVAGAGGQVVMPAMDVMDAGRMAFIQDPTGAVVGLWQAGEHHGSQLANEPGAFSWNELITDDPAAAQKFYADVLGWSYTPMVVETTDYIVFNDSTGKGVGGIMGKPPTMPAEVPSHWMAYFNTADCDATAARAGELGGQVIAEPFDVEGVGRIAVLADPQGAAFSVMAPAD